MNQEQFGWFWPQLKVPLKAKWEQFTDDDLTQIEGQVDNFNRVTETRYGKKKDEVRKWANRRYAHWTASYQGYEDQAPSA